MHLITYLWTNLYLGAGIAADVYAATLSGFREFEKDDYLRKWVRRNSLTHTIFPLVGMYMVVAGIAIWRPLTSILFGFGALLLGSFLVHLIVEKAGGEEEQAKEKENGFMTRLFSPVTRRLARIDPQWALVMGVSMDAINSGFAKAADTKHWSWPLLVLSFPLVGGVVGLGAWLGGKKAKWFLSFLKNVSGANTILLAKRLVRLETLALAIEFLVLGYFFWRSVASALEPLQLGDWLQRLALSWSASIVTSCLISLIWGRKIVANINNEALRSFAVKHG